MISWTASAPTLVAAFMASLVEFVEALTIVLAVGVVRGWRSALLGAGAGAALLLALVVVLGPSLTRIPLPVVQVVIGTLLLMFGLRWLRKAVLRAAGVLALHDEDAAFAAQSDAMRAAGGSRAGLDAVAFLASFKSVVLEGVEVVFIVVAIGAGGRLLLPAAAGAALALALVVALGLWLHRPLARVPENTLKFGVGVMLSAFGAFWGAEGLGMPWPGGDLALLALIAAFGLVALLLVPACIGTHGAALQRGAGQAARKSSREEPAGLVASIVRELAGLFVDDVWLALGIPIVLALAWLAMQRPGLLAPGAAGLSLSAALLALLAASALRRAAA